MGKCALLWVNLLALLRRRGVCLLLAALSAGGVFAVLSLSGLEARQVRPWRKWKPPPSFPAWSPTAKA